MSATQIWRRASRWVSTRRVNRSASTDTGHTRAAHQPRDAFSADALSILTQFGVDPRRAIGSTRLRVNAHDLFAKNLILARSFGLLA
jgi:hypothetical protein